MIWESQDHHVPYEVYERDLAGPIRTRMADAMQRLCPWLSGEQAVLCIESIVAQLHGIVMAHMWPQGGRAGRMQLDVEAKVRHLVAFSAAGIRQYDGRGQMDGDTAPM